MVYVALGLRISIDDVGMYFFMAYVQHKRSGGVGAKKNMKIAHHQ